MIENILWALGNNPIYLIAAGMLIAYVVVEVMSNILGLN